MEKEIRTNAEIPKEPRSLWLRFRTGIFVLVVISTLLVFFNFWFLNHARHELERFVIRQSKNTLKLNIDEFKFNWIKNKIELNNAVLETIDSLSPVVHKVKLGKTLIKARGFLPLLFNKEILIDSIGLYNPEIEFIRTIKREKSKKRKVYRDSVSQKNKTEKFSVASELGRISKIITDVINVLQVNRFRIENGSFLLLDKTKPGESPFLVNKVFIELDNLHLQAKKSKQENKVKAINFTDNIAIRTSNQNIQFPGGRHYLQFKNFRVILQKKLVEFDSCTISASKGDSSRTSFKIIFDKLALTNINFDSLYSNETIIADSVYCYDSKIHFDIEGKQKQAEREKLKSNADRIDRLVQQLFGDLKLNYVGIKNSDITISTIKKGEVNSFSSKGNDLEIHNLLVKQDEKKPISVDQLSMAIHRSDNLLQGGRYAISFDSIGFQNNLINLSQFSFKEFYKGKIVRNLTMPIFRVNGLSLEALIYKNTFSADRALFVKPNVEIVTGIRKNKTGQRNLFQTLARIDDIMDLRNLDVQEGNIKIRFANHSILDLSNVNFSLWADVLVNANQIKNVPRSFKTLSFDKGIFKKDDLTAVLTGVQLSENKNGLFSKYLQLKSNKLRGDVHNVALGKIQLDSIKQSIIVDGAHWTKADVLIHTLTKHGNLKLKQNTKGVWVFKNIQGENTTIKIEANDSKLSGLLNNLYLDYFLKDANGKLQIDGVRFEGNDFNIEKHNSIFRIGKMDVADKTNSVLLNLFYQNRTKKDTIDIKVPMLYFVPDINEIANGVFNFNTILLTDPKINAQIGKNTSEQLNTRLKVPEFSVKSLQIERPVLQLKFVDKNDSATRIYWDGRKSGIVAIKDLQSNRDSHIFAKQANLSINNFEFQNTKAKNLPGKENAFLLTLNEIEVRNDELHKAINWSAHLNLELQNPYHISVPGKGNNQIELTKGVVQNVSIGSGIQNNINNLFSSSPNLKYNNLIGKYSSEKYKLYWYGLSGSNAKFEIDSISFLPTQSYTSYRTQKDFNDDFLRINTRRINAEFNVNGMLSADTVLMLRQINLNDVNLFTFKDKTQPDTPRYKPLLPVMLRNLKKGIIADSIRINNMSVSYQEINKDTDSLGEIYLTNLDAVIANLKNRGIEKTDSIDVLVTADVLGQLPVWLNVKQSYADSTGYFTMKLKTGSTDLKVFNQTLIPLVAVKVFEGKLDSMELSVQGNQELAKGVAMMNYKGLKAGFLSKKDFNSQTFKEKFLSKLAMLFVIRKNNKGKPSPVFFQRMKNKVFTNYLIKISLEGIKSSIGLPTTKRNMKKYYRHQKKTASKKF